MLRFGEAEGCPRASPSSAHPYRATTGYAAICLWETCCFWDSPDTPGAAATVILEAPTPGVGHPTCADLPTCVHGFSDAWPFPRVLPGACPVSGD